mmetsp:Transcript_16481/g.29996  ORF Transcript_16481/g.29996 Transcript_16481/m.29996 type:complete len:161 (-) Transcript_16481:17-499(-)
MAKMVGGTAAYSSSFRHVRACNVGSSSPARSAEDCTPKIYMAELQILTVSFHRSGVISLSMTIDGPNPIPTPKPVPPHAKTIRNQLFIVAAVMTSETAIIMYPVVMQRKRPKASPAEATTAPISRPMLAFVMSKPRAPELTFISAAAETEIMFRQVKDAP